MVKHILSNLDDFDQIFTQESHLLFLNCSDLFSTFTFVIFSKAVNSEKMSLSNPQSTVSIEGTKPKKKTAAWYLCLISFSFFAFLIHYYDIFYIIIMILGYFLYPNIFNQILFSLKKWFSS